MRRQTMHLRVAAAAERYEIVHLIVFPVSVDVVDHNIFRASASHATWRSWMRPAVIVPVMAQPILILVIFTPPLIPAAAHTPRDMWIPCGTAAHDLFASHFPSAIVTVICLLCPKPEHSPAAAAMECFHRYTHSSSPYLSPTATSATSGIKFSSGGRASMQPLTNAAASST